MQQFFGPYGNNPKGFKEFTRIKTSKTFTSNKISKKLKRKENHIEYFDHKIIEQRNQQTQTFGVHLRTESFNYFKVPNNGSATLINFWIYFQGLRFYLEGYV